MQPARQEGLPLEHELAREEDHVGIALDQLGHELAQFIEHLMAHGGHGLGLAAPALNKVHVPVGLVLHVRPQPLNLV